MSDETNTSERVGFCQDCGKPLSKETVRAVGSGVFCEPCLQTRLNASQGAAPTAAGTGYAAAPAYAGEPHPWLAALLGCIPGVGAMYNGQFAKGIAHLVVFAVLVSLSKHVSDVFGLFLTAWIFYMAFDAYHTARARRDGLPLPNAFGFNDIGEKMGFGKNWGTVTPQAPVTPPAAAQAPAPTPAANWAGYVPPVSAGTSYPRSAPYSAPYTAPVTPIPPPPAPYSSPYNEPPMPSAYPIPVVPAPGASFPLIAIWLIGLGVLFALAEWMPRWHVSSSAVVAILLGAWAASWFVRRLGYMGGMSYQGPMLHMMRGPVLVAVVAVLFLLQGVHAATLGQTWPVFLVALGAVLLGERLGVGTQPYHPQDAGQASVVPPASAATTSTTTTNENNDERDGYSR